MSSREYILDSTSEPGREQLGSLPMLLDAPTREVLEGVGIQPGRRCLDIGAGDGSIARWLAERTGPAGGVVAVDVDTDHLVGRPGVEVLRHDINDGVPSGGPFDVIHARLVLLHLSRREEILNDLVEALAPGGWLVIGEYGDRLPYALSAASRADMETFDRIQHIGHHVIGAAAGQSIQWAHQVEAHMDASGLVDIHAIEHSHTSTGGGTGCLYHRSLIVQIEAPLLAAGVTADEFERYCDLLLDPRFRAWFYQFICTRGRKPLLAPTSR
ncbi:MAG: methyltransferase domain-containing protein [Pseudonocardia sp.]|nr:methyltransferase domain-containing protein [Pseudonocardia sp.]